MRKGLIRTMKLFVAASLREALRLPVTLRRARRDGYKSVLEIVFRGAAEQDLDRQLFVFVFVRWLLPCESLRI